MSARRARSGPRGRSRWSNRPVYELALDAKTARTLGIVIPPSMQMRTDRMIG